MAGGVEEEAAYGARKRGRIQHDSSFMNILDLRDKSSMKLKKRIAVNDNHASINQQA